MLFIFFLLSFLFLWQSTNLLLCLLILEILSFFLIFFTTTMLSLIFSFDFIIILMFSIFVMEGVMGLSGLILLVSFTGSDYIKSSSILKC